MDKKIKIGTLLLLMFWTTSVFAILVDNGDGTVTDTDSNLMWIKDTTLAPVGGDGTWSGTMAFIDSFTYAGYDDWRLPTALNKDGTLCTGYDCTDTEFGSLYYTALGNSAGAISNLDVFNVDLVNSSWFWTSTKIDGLCYGDLSNSFSNPCTELGYQFRFELGQMYDYNPINDTYGFPEPLFSYKLLLE